MRPLLILIAFFISLQSYSQTIHFMMVADNDATDAGVAASKMTQYMLNKTFVPNLRNYTGLNVHVTELTGRSFSLQNLNNELNRLQSSSGDVIFFYYCGHGYNAGDNDPFPTLWFGNNSSVKKFSSVYNSLNSKPHRLLIAIAEACNAVVQSRPTNHSINSQGDFEPHFAKAEKYRKLFCESSGDYIMSSSSKGELSQFINSWGIFSTAFIESFEKAVENNANPNPTWEDIFNNIVSKTIKDAYENVGTSQRPQWKKVGGTTPTPPVAHKVLTPSFEHKLNKMFEKPKHQYGDMLYKGKYFNIETSPNGLFLVKCSKENPGKYFFGHLGKDDFYAEIQTMIVTDTDDFLVIDMNNSNNYRQYDNKGNIYSNTTSSKKNYHYSCIEYANGDIYLGETVNGKYDGFGLYVWANGNSWYGKWSNGIRLGYGIYCPYYGSQQVTIGYWNNNDYRSQ